MAFGVGASVTTGVIENSTGRLLTQAENLVGSVSGRGAVERSLVEAFATAEGTVYKNRLTGQTLTVAEADAIRAGEMAAKRAGETLSRPGGVIRRDAIPEGSQLEYLGPGRVKFDGVEFRAVRDLSHLSEGELRIMAKRGNSFSDINGNPIHGHHFNQLDHRHVYGFIVEIPRNKHNYANKIQHPKANGEGLPDVARKEWNETLRPAYWQERARTELLRRGLV